MKIIQIIATVIHEAGKNPAIQWGIAIIMTCGSFLVEDRSGRDKGTDHLCENREELNVGIR